MLTDLNGKAVLITGAATGIGAAAARAFARVGSRVGVHYHRSRAAADDITSTIAAAGGCAMPMAADLATSGAAEKLVDDFVTSFGRIDVLINNAGDIGRRGPFLETTDDLFETVLNLNVRPVVAACRAAVRYFRQQGGGGTVINTTSMAARGGGGPGAQLYASSKAFVQTFTRALAKEYAAEGIRFNAVAPGVIKTPIHDRHTTPAQLETMRKNIPMGRLGTPEDCAGAFLFLASDTMSGFITGQIIEVNGGQLMP